MMDQTIDAAKWAYNHWATVLLVGAGAIKVVDIGVYLSPWTIDDTAWKWIKKKWKGYACWTKSS